MIILVMVFNMNIHMLKFIMRISFCLLLLWVMKNGTVGCSKRGASWSIRHLAQIYALLKTHTDYYYYYQHCSLQLCFLSESHFSTSIAAMQPKPAAVTACLYL